MNMTPGIMIGFLAGLSAGAILGILFAPKKGEETRRELREKAMAARNKMQAQMMMQKNKLKNAAQASKEPAEQTGESAEEPTMPR